ncbi:methionine--tRNA ligase [Patescibacteria group bacterium]|nr:methionine--tRNA ligase [Patescibacteria group bacterium]MBU3999988.1 methionine--tRNA ligase [Patescibacteria group bacterium]MBU4057232.1 methionine--tRNA ligase [Patescibacteria group bacterium]MBU4368342.1 methionine--tRNA ligase [Patescibacteria group bacterium]
MQNKKFYITTPIYYANAKPHIGHAYTTVAADVLARFHRLQGEEVFFLAGLDEHGLKIQRIAEKAGKNPQGFVNEISQEFKRLWDKLNIKYDGFIRTTAPEHKKAVQKALQRLYDRRSIYKGMYEGLYCVGCEQFKTESDLVDGKCPDHNAAPEHLKEECYFLKMSELQNSLIKKIKKDEFQITPDKYKKEILSFLEKHKLRDISISRKNISWGIPLPLDSTHTIYVWVDAFLNYLTGIGWKGEPNKIPEQWPPDIQLMGKDILRVHATIWPVILLHLGISLPKKLFTHGFILSGGKKMSKTLGNTIAPEEMIEKFGVDGTRYLLMSAGTFGEDVDLTMERAAGKYEADLANGLGNLVARTLAMTEKYCEGKIPKINKDPEKHPLRTDKNIHNWKKVWQDLDENLANLRLNEAIGSIWKFIAEADNYIERNKPWNLAKLGKTEELNWALYGLLDGIHQVAWQIYPFIPETSLKIAEALDIKGLLKKSPNYKDSWINIKPGTKIKKGAVLFPRLGSKV